MIRNRIGGFAWLFAAMAVLFARRRQPKHREQAGPSVTMSWCRRAAHSPRQRVCGSVTAFPMLLAQPRPGERAYGLLPHPHTIASMLINDLADIDNEVFLFMDDYHSVPDSAIRGAVSFLLR
jgi:hypothetical protein